jgi:redox-sensing transcriptional repressor
VQVLESLQRDGTEVISSEPLAKACNVNASQIRKDLAYFGEFGVRGVGYYVKNLIESITSALGVDREWKTVLIGVGNLGRALLNHKEFKLRGFHIVGAFDCDPFKIGEEISGLEVVCTKRLKERVGDLGVEIGIITTPPERAQRAANHLIEAGIKGILKFPWSMWTFSTISTRCLSISRSTKTNSNAQHTESAALSLRKSSDRIQPLRCTEYRPHRPVSRSSIQAGAAAPALTDNHRPKRRSAQSRRNAAARPFRVSFAIKE